MTLAAADSRVPTARPRRTTFTLPRATSMVSSTTGTPALPMAIMKRPMLGSWPKKAVLTSLELATVKATLRASATLRAPSTRTSTSLVVPSPSATILSASSFITRVISRSSTSSPSPPRAILGFPATPLARHSTVSLVLVSPSTVMAWKVASVARRTMGRSAAGATAASVST